jgi:hypothetical protein
MPVISAMALLPFNVCMRLNSQVTLKASGSQWNNAQCSMLNFQLSLSVEHCILNITFANAN